MVGLWEEYLKISGWESGYSSVNNLLRHLRYRKTGSERSRETYCSSVHSFCIFTDKFPDELVVLEKEDIEKLIEDYCYHNMERRWKSPRTANSVLFRLKTFFKVNGFRGNRSLDIDCFHQSVRERIKPQYIPTIDEARRMAEVAGSLRNRAIILFLSSTGLRNSTLRALQYGAVKEELEKGVTNIHIRVHKGMKKVVNSACKGNIEYFVFTSGEATEALRLYLTDRRKRLGELHDDDVLFCAEYNQISRSLRARRPLTSRELQLLIKESARKAGIKEWNDVYPHCLRKTFDSVLRSQFLDGGRLDLKTQEFFMGHILGGSMDTYFDKTKIEELRKEYSKLIFKPLENMRIDVLEPLQGMARVLGIDVAQLEEYRKKELGRALNDPERLIMMQEAIEQLLSQFRSISELSKEAKPVMDVLGEKPSDNDVLATHTERQLQEETPEKSMPQMDVEPEGTQPTETVGVRKSEEKPETGRHQIMSCNEPSDEQTQNKFFSPSPDFNICPASEDFDPIESQTHSASSSIFSVEYTDGTWGKTLGKLVINLGCHSGDVKAFYYLLRRKEPFTQSYPKFVIEHNGKDAYKIVVLEKELADLIRKRIGGRNL